MSVVVSVVVSVVSVVVSVFILWNDLAAGSGQFCNVVNRIKIAKRMIKKRSEPVLWLRGPLWTGGACVWRLRPRPSRHKQRDTHGPACPNTFFFVIFYVLLFLFSFLREKKKEILRIKNRSKERPSTKEDREIMERVGGGRGLMSRFIGSLNGAGPLLGVKEVPLEVVDVRCC